MGNNYTVVSASAGSGKTYYLVQQVLSICLRYPNSEKKIGQILALTFTNKAANEMKARIFDWLKEVVITSPEHCEKLVQLKEELQLDNIQVTVSDLHQRAKKLLDYILHHYSVLNISTIDKFNSRLVKSFSNELGLAKNFNLEINAEPYLKEAIDQLLDNIGEDDFYSSLFMDYIDYKFENNAKVNLKDNLFRTSKTFLSDMHYEALKSNSKFDIEQYTEKTEFLRLQNEKLKEQSRTFALEANNCISENDLQIEDFSGGAKNSIAIFFKKYLDYHYEYRDDFPFPSDEEKAIVVFDKLASSKSKKRQADIAEIIDFLKEKRLVIIQSYIQIKKNESILEALLPLKVNKDIQDELSKIETESDLVFLSKFNTLIKENLKDEPSAFIYEKIGTKFQHFFFDEFQDTSLMQWQNFVPLRDHTISMEDTSFTVVGDPKQSIYRFRGGDSQLMLSLINKTEKSPLAAHTKVLKYNWRSANNIVKFNNELYQYQSQFLEEQHQKIFSEDAQQIPKNKTLEGRVKINLLENSSQPEFFENLANAMHNNIQDCLEHGFSMSDITILCRGNKDIVRLSQLLGYKKVIYKGKSSFIKTISEKGLTLNLSYTLKALISFLTWKTNTQNKRNLVDTLYWLQQLGRVKFHDFSSEVFSLLALQHDGLILEKLSNKYALNLQDSHLPQLNLYNFVEYFLKEFCVPEKETDFVLSFLEILHGFGQNVGLGLKDFLQYWNDEGRETSIAASENVDAVQLMTIHKAKGLEFPIVFFALRNDNDKEGKFSAWLQQDDEILPSVYLPNFSSELTNYDEELKEFNDFHTYENRMDNLCVQYVATTRPVEQLYLYLEKPGKDGISKIELYDFVKQYNVNNEEQFDLYPGDYNKQKKEKNSNLQHHKIVSVFPMDSQKISKITIATPSKTYQFRNDKVRQGILMHEILSKIKYPNDLKFVLKEYSLNGILTASEIKILKKELKKVIANNESYFSEKYTVINEREILISNKDGISLHRPDRLLMDIDGNCTIIDFKTGTEKPEHQRQVEKYKLVLEKIGYRVVETKIIYTQQ